MTPRDRTKRIVYAARHYSEILPTMTEQDLRQLYEQQGSPASDDLCSLPDDQELKVNELHARLQLLASTHQLSVVELVAAILSETGDWQKVRLWPRMPKAPKKVTVEQLTTLFRKHSRTWKTWPMYLRVSTEDFQQLLTSEPDPQHALVVKETKIWICGQPVVADLSVAPGQVVLR